MWLRIALCASLCMVAGAPAPLLAQEFPTRPITMVVPFPPGGGTDVAGRLIAERMSVTLGQKVLVANRPGAGGNIGAASVARSTPDGYTLVMATQGTHGSNMSLYKDMPYDTVADFTPISLVASTPLILVSNLALPVSNVRQLIELAKSRPGALNYGSSSVGGSPHLAMELLKSMTGVDMVHVPYQGSAPARTALLAGEISVMFDNIPSSLPLARDGRFRALGVSGGARSIAAPDIPTVAQAGVPGFEMIAWYGLLSAANTPLPVVHKLHSAIVDALKAKDVADRLIGLGFEPVGSTPEAFAGQIRSDIEKYRKLVEVAGLKKQ